MKTIEHQTTVTIPVTLRIHVHSDGWRIGCYITDDSDDAITDAFYEQLETEITELVGCELRPSSRKPTASEAKPRPQP